MCKYSKLHHWREQRFLFAASDGELDSDVEQGHYGELIMERRWLGRETTRWVLNQSPVEVVDNSELDAAWVTKHDGRARRRSLVVVTWRIRWRALGLVFSRWEAWLHSGDRRLRNLHRFWDVHIEEEDERRSSSVEDLFEKIRIYQKEWRKRNRTTSKKRNKK